MADAVPKPEAQPPKKEEKPLDRDMSAFFNSETLSDIEIVNPATPDKVYK